MNTASRTNDVLLLRIGSHSLSPEPNLAVTSQLAQSPVGLKLSHPPPYISTQPAHFSFILIYLASS